MDSHLIYFIPNLYRLILSITHRVCHDRPQAHTRPRRCLFLHDMGAIRQAILLQIDCLFPSRVSESRLYRTPLALQRKSCMPIQNIIPPSAASPPLGKPKVYMVSVCNCQGPSQSLCNFQGCKIQCPIRYVPKRIPGP